MIGRRLGRYRVLSRLGAGGMSTVWEARDELLGHDVALKVLSDALAESDEARRRFRHEGQLAAVLEHPGIARVYEAGEDHGVAFLAMERVRGETLDERIGRGMLPIGESIRIAAAVAEALAFAHARGVVHRDVTPRNIMLTADDRVLVMDFGLALAAGQTRLSSSHTVLGTAAYVAPEVLLGRDADARADQYALGVVLFRCLTGSLPVGGDRSEALTYGTLHQPARRASDLRPGIPPGVEALLERLLSREPEGRFAEDAEMVAALRGLASSAGAAAGAAAAPGADRRAAEAVARADAARYLAIAPIRDLSATDGAEGARREFRKGLAASLPAFVARARRVHVVPFDPGPDCRDDAALRAAADRSGANAMLVASLRANAEEARVTFEILELASGVRIGGGVVAGSLRDPFAFEDAIGRQVCRALGLEGPDDDGPPRPGSPDPAATDHFAQAIRYLRRSDLEASVDGAIGLLERLRAADPACAAYEATLGRAFVAKHAITREQVWLARAAEALDRASVRDAGSAEVALGRGDLFVASGLHGAALREYERALGLRPQWVEAWHGQSRALEALGRSAEAEEACRHAIAAAPEDWRGHQRLAVVLIKRGDYQGALEPCRRVTELVPDNAKGFQNLGSALFHLDRNDDSLLAFRRSLELRPSPHAYTSLGTVLYYLGRMDEACDAFERAVAMSPADPVVWGNLGEACIADERRHARGEEALRMAIGLMRPRLERHAATAEDEARFAGWLASMGDADGARSAAARALERDPFDVHSMVATAIVHEQAGDRASCLRLLERAVRAGYGTGTLERSPRLRALRDDLEFQRILRLGGTSAEAVPVSRKGRGGA